MKLDIFKKIMISKPLLQLMDLIKTQQKMTNLHLLIKVNCLELSLTLISTKNNI